MTVSRTPSILLTLAVTAFACNSKNSIGTEVKPGTPPPASTTPLEQVEADSREPLLAEAISGLLEHKHVRHGRLTDEVSDQAFSEYIKALDPGKLFLLAGDVKTLSAYRLSVDDEMHSGDLELARVGAALVVKRQKAIAAAVDKQLAVPFDFDVSESFEADSDKRVHVDSEAAVIDRWRKLLKYEAIERIERMDEVAKAAASIQKKDGGADAGPTPSWLKNIPKTFEGREAKARKDLAKTYSARFTRLVKVDALEPAETLLNAVTSVYDPHTTYLKPAERDNFDIQMTGSLEGIGAVLQEDDHYIKIQEIVPGGASWRDGRLKAGDLILAVAQAGDEPTDIADMRIGQVVKLIRGPKGTVVTLTVRKPDDTVVVIAITRDIVAIESAFARGAMLRTDGGQPVGYVYLPSFYGGARSRASRSATVDVRGVLEALVAKGAKSVILDIRSNSGGLLDHARDISGLFIEQGPIVQTRYSDGQSDVLIDRDKAVVFGGQVIVMTNRFSASASEIVAGALQDYRRAVVVGTGPTHGKGTVQILLDLDRVAGNTGKSLGVLKLTIQQYFRVNGESTQWRGVVPDIALPDPFGHIESGERHLDHSIPWSKVDAVPHKKWAPTWDLDGLRNSSAARVAAEPTLAAVAKRTAYLKARQKDTLLPLKRTEWLARRASDKAALDAVDPKLSERKSTIKVDMVIYGAANGAAGKSARIKRWKKNIARDPWLEEAIRIANEMMATAPAK